MLHTLAVSNYRSLRELVIPLGQLTVITGPNASGKSNLYKTLRLFSDTALGSATTSLAREGGLSSVLWAGPESFAKSVKSGEHPVQGGPRKDRVNLKLGLGGYDYSYSIDFGLPTPSRSVFSGDPEIKRECIWHGPQYRPAASVIDRKNSIVKSRDEDGEWSVITSKLPLYESMLAQIVDTKRAPEVTMLREAIRSWRFYDHFRTDVDAPARQKQVGVRTTVLSHDGHDLASALQTIREIGDPDALDEAVDDAFPGANIEISISDGLFGIDFNQHGLLRPLTEAELSDGTLRYLFWIAALLTPRPPQLMVLNEPETSLHPDLMPALARLIIKACENTQVWVVSHSPRLTAALEEDEKCVRIMLEKELGETHIADQGFLDSPSWKWPSR